MMARRRRDVSVRLDIQRGALDDFVLEYAFYLPSPSIVRVIRVQVVSSPSPDQLLDSSSTQSPSGAEGVLGKDKAGNQP